MGLTEGSDRNYLRVSHGGIRKTVKEGTPKAKSRENQEGLLVWELVWRDVSGTLDAILFRDHEEYGKQWTLLINDEPDHFALQISENTRYGTDLLKKIPNLKRGMAIKVMPYDFKDDDDKVHCGLSIVDEMTKEKIVSFYQRWIEGVGGQKPVVENLYGYPGYSGKWKDKDEVKVYFILLAKFLRSKALEYIEKGFRDYPSQSKSLDELSEKIAQEEKDDLPF